ARCTARRGRGATGGGNPPERTMLAASGMMTTCSQKFWRTTSSTAVLPAPGPPVKTTSLASACDDWQLQRLMSAPPLENQQAARAVGDVDAVADHVDADRPL